MTENDLSYLKSCLRHLQEYHNLVSEAALGVSIGTEALADNIDWLDCFIDSKERAATAPERRKRP
jgi:hypothetical protein